VFNKVRRKYEKNISFNYVFNNNNLLFPFRTYADIGPKPSIKLIVLNPPKDEYYLDLLINYETKHSYINIDEEDGYDENMVRI